jgi:hypothetical protein
MNAYPCIGGPKDRQWLAMPQSRFTVSGMQPALAPTLPTTVNLLRHRAWAERLLSWPWQPWRDTDVVCVQLPFQPVPHWEWHYEVRRYDTVAQTVDGARFRCYWVERSITDDEVRRRIEDSRELARYHYYGKEPA